MRIYLRLAGRLITKANNIQLVPRVVSKQVAFRSESHEESSSRTRDQDLNN